MNLSGNTGAPFTIPEEIYNNLITAEGVEPGSMTTDLYTITDQAFAEYLNYRLAGQGIIVKEGNTYQIDKEKAAAYTGELQLSKAAAYLTELSEAGVETASTKITNVDGLQWFIGVTNLILTSNELTTIDLTILVNLESVTLNNNWIATLDVTKNTKLTVLNYNASSSSSAPTDSKLTAIDLSKNILLTTLSMTNHSISAIDLSANKALTSVNLSGNPGAPFKIPAEIYNNLTIANGVEPADN
ncbi:MAG: hypothetical protein LUD15_14505 [Bacteroides sp.]|nr:hypothetical protein [Bacteroides sp.]